MRAADVMTCDLKTVTPETPAAEIAASLISQAFTALPVVTAEGTLIGLVDEGCLIRREPPGGSSVWGWLRQATDVRAAITVPPDWPAERIMSRDFVVVEEETPFKTVVELLSRRRIKRVPVLRGEELVGLICRVDALRALAGHPPSRLPRPSTPRPTYGEVTGR